MCLDSRAVFGVQTRFSSTSQSNPNQNLGPRTSQNKYPSVTISCLMGIPKTGLQLVQNRVLLFCRTVASELQNRLEDKESGATFLVGLKQRVTDFKAQAKVDMEKCEQKQDGLDDDSTTAGGLSSKRLRSLLFGSEREKKNKKKKGKASESAESERSDDDESEDNDNDDNDEADSSNTWKLDDAGELQMKKIQKERAKAKKKQQDRAYNWAC